MVDVGKRFAAGIAKLTRSRHESLVSGFVLLPNRSPIHAFPPANVALGECFQDGRLQSMRLGDDLSRLHGSPQRARIAVIDWPDGEKVASRLRLADSER